MVVASRDQEVSTGVKYAKTNALVNFVYSYLL